MIELCSGQLPFADKYENSMTVMFKIAHGERPSLSPNHRNNASEAMVLFADRCCQTSPADRPTVETLREDVWLSRREGNKQQQGSIMSRILELLASISTEDLEDSSASSEATTVVPNVAANPKYFVANPLERRLDESSLDEKDGSDAEEKKERDTLCGNINPSFRRTLSKPSDSAVNSGSRRSMLPRKTGFTPKVLHRKNPLGDIVPVDGIDAALKRVPLLSTSGGLLGSFYESNIEKSPLEHTGNAQLTLSISVSHSPHNLSYCRMILIVG